MQSSIFNIILDCVTTYNAFLHIVPRFRFSRQGFNDVSVSVVSISSGANPVLQFAVSSRPLPIRKGLGNTRLRTTSGCTISSVEFNTYTGWIAQSFNGFSLVQRNSDLYLEVG